MEREGKPEWIRPRQVTELFGIGRGTVTTLINDRKIKSVSLCHDGLGRGSRRFFRAKGSPHTSLGRRPRSGCRNMTED